VTPEVARPAGSHFAGHGTNGTLARVSAFQQKRSAEDSDRDREDGGHGRDQVVGTSHGGISGELRQSKSDRLISRVAGAPVPTMTMK
jgi:hypothetical protein